jgi:hypothetical protein
VVVPLSPLKEKRERLKEVEERPKRRVENFVVGEKWHVGKVSNFYRSSKVGHRTSQAS